MGNQAPRQPKLSIGDGVIPAKAGIQSDMALCALDSGFRRNDDRHVTPGQHALAIVVEIVDGDLARVLVRPDRECHRERHVGHLGGRIIDEQVAVEMRERGRLRSVRPELQHETAILLRHHRIAEIVVGVSAGIG